MRPILITGRLSTGKSVASDFFTRQYSHRKFSMASWLKYAITQHYEIDSIHKNMEINGKSIRKIMQQVGMYMRMVDINWHVDEVIKQIKAGYFEKKFVIDDVRFVNEVENLKQFHPIVIKLECDKLKRVERAILRDNRVPSEEELNDISESEVDLIKADYTVSNNGDVYDLHQKLGEIYEIEKNRISQ